MTVVVIIAALVLSALTGWPLVALILRWSEGGWSKKRDRRDAATSQPDVAVEESSKDTTSADSADRRTAAQLLRGGLWIGLLERVAVTGAVLLGEYTIVAAVVAVKGLGRFKELSTPEASERFVVGTLASLTWAGLLGAAGLGILDLLG
ncbi:MAG: hypothetical protein ACTIJJ_13360 [Galactobacter sp.]|uniref:hypothetical protein n=1 Tax=Galactobacter sp. TaxID=2676125 RepID=UPI0025B9B701|nr:hypothetical protein [Galactobacter sp.]